MKFWDESETKRPFRKAGDVLIRPFHLTLKNEWDNIFITKFKNGEIISSDRGKKTFVPIVRETLMKSIEPGVQISNLNQRLWQLTKEEKELIEEVNVWLNKNIKGKTLLRKDLE